MHTIKLQLLSSAFEGLNPVFKIVKSIRSSQTSAESSFKIILKHFNQIDKNRHSLFGILGKTIFIKSLDDIT